MRFRIMSKNEAEISSADLASLDLKDLAVSFGFQDFDYSPACLIKSCILKRGDNGAILESIPFSNIISQTLYQFTSSKEQQGSASLLNGTVVNAGRKSTLINTKSSLIQNPVEVQIMLRDIFEVCKSPKFWLSETKGLEISLEMEDKLDLMKVDYKQSSVDMVSNKDPSASSAYSTYPVNLETNPSQAFPSPAFPDIIAGDQTTISMADRGVYYNAKETFGLVHYKPDPPLPAWGNAGIPPNQYLPLNKYTATATEIAQMGFAEGDEVKLSFGFSSSVTNEQNPPKIFEMANKIITIQEFTAAAAHSFDDIGGYDGGAAPAVWDQATWLPSGANADWVNFKVNIVNDDVSKGTYKYELDVGSTFTNDQAYTAGMRWIIPVGSLGGPAPSSPGVTDPGNLTLTLNVDVSSGTAPTIDQFTLTGAPTGVNQHPKHAKLIFEQTWYADGVNDVVFMGLEKNKRVSIGDATTGALKTSENALDLRDKNQLTLNEDDFANLKTMGIVDVNNKAIPNATFEFGYQIHYKKQAYTGSGTASITREEMVSTKEITMIAPDVLVGDTMASNGIVRMPNSGRGVKLLSATKVHDFWQLQFSDLGFGSNIGPTFKQVWRDSNTSPCQITDKSFFDDAENRQVDLFFMASMYPATALSNTTLQAKLSAGLTYEIDLFEVVLQQQTKNKKMPMAKAYTTYRVEPFVIQDSVIDFERQFNVTENNCYNLALLMPQAGSLVSTGRGVHSYRYQINNIANTSTDINLRSNLSEFYSSAMHLDKMLDYFGNSTNTLRNFFGLKGVADMAYPVQILPLKVYTANDTSSYFTNARGFSCQLLLHGDSASNRNIIKGQMYMMKSVVQMI